MRFRPVDGLNQQVSLSREANHRCHDDHLAERDRDESGRPRSERPGDALAFNAHEVLEIAWKNGPDDEKTLWRALAQWLIRLKVELPTFIDFANRAEGPDELANAQSDLNLLGLIASAP
jgi:hypothetical protein